MPAEQSAAKLYARASGAVLLGQLAYYAVYLWGMRLILSTLPKGENGLLTYVQQWTSAVLSIAMLNGYNTLIIKRLRSESNAIELFSTVVTLRAMIGAAVSLVLAVTLSFVGEVPYTTTLVASLATLVLSRGMALRSTLELPFHARMRFELPAALNILDIVLIVTLLWWYRSGLDAATVLAIQAIGALPGFVALIALTWKDGVFRVRLSKQALGTLLGNTGWLGTTAIFIYAHMLLDVTLLDLVGNRTMVGIFGAANSASLPMSILQGIVWSPLIPLLSQRLLAAHREAHADMERVFRLATVAIVLAGCIMAAAMPFIIGLLTNGVYADHTLEFLLQLWALSFSAIVFGVQHYASLVERYRIAAITSALLVVGSVVFDWWLIGTLGTQGIFVAKVLSHVLAITCAAVMFRRDGYERITIALARSGIWIGVTGPLIGLASIHLDNMMARLIAMVGIAVMAAVATGAIRTDDRRFIARLIQSYRTARA